MTLSEIMSRIASDDYQFAGGEHALAEACSRFMQDDVMYFVVATRSGGIIRLFPELRSAPPSSAVHILSGGRALCGRFGVPRDWPEEETYVAIDDAQALEVATCALCRSRYQEARSRKGTKK